MRRTRLFPIALLAMLGCQEQREDAQKAVEAAKALSQLAEGAKEQAQRIEQAQAEAEKAAQAEVPEGTDPEAAKQQVEMAKAMAAMQALGKAGGAAVNWRQLVPFVPDKIGAFSASGDIDGSTKKVGGGMQVTQVSRRYKAGEQSLKLEITDAFTAPFLRAPFAMAALVEEDSTRGYKKGKKVAGNTAIVEWTEQSKRSHAVMLVADRFVLTVTVQKADKHDAAEGVIGQLAVAELAKVTPEEEAKAE